MPPITPWTSVGRSPGVVDFSSSFALRPQTPLSLNAEAPQPAMRSAPFAAAARIWSLCEVMPADDEREDDAAERDHREEDDRRARRPRTGSASASRRRAQ